MIFTESLTESLMQNISNIKQHLDSVFTSVQNIIYQVRHLPLQYDISLPAVLIH